MLSISGQLNFYFWVHIKHKFWILRFLLVSNYKILFLKKLLFLIVCKFTTKIIVKKVTFCEFFSISNYLLSLWMSIITCYICAIRSKPVESDLASLDPSRCRNCSYFFRVEGLFGCAVFYGYELSPSFPP